MPQLTDQTLALLQNQLDKEGRAHLTYLAMAGWAEVQGYSGAAQFLEQHAGEEHQHMMRIYRYLVERERQPYVDRWGEIVHDYPDLPTLFAQVLAQEEQITASIHALVAHVQAERDWATNHFLQWFVAEQEEEEQLARRALELFKLIPFEGTGPFLIDQALGQLTQEQEADHNIKTPV